MKKIIQLFDRRIKSLFTQASSPTIERLIFEMKKSQYDLFNQSCNELGVSDRRYASHDIIVSLTTYGKRIWDVYLAIESIMQQTFKPNRIVLNLDNSFRDIELPITIQRQINRGLEINYCEDLKSFKKLIPTIQKYPDSAIITIDDDIIYEIDLLERIIRNYNRFPTCIHASRVLKMNVHNNVLGNYSTWGFNYDEYEPNKLNFLTGGAGTLYPPHSLPDEVLNKEKFMELCPYADDVWFNAMAILNGTPIQKVQLRHSSGEDYVSNPYVQDIGLCVENNSLTCSRNDIQIKKTFEYYGIDKILEIKIL